jgi:hypothetical protein
VTSRRGRAPDPFAALNPFGALGLPARADLTDGDVQAAWRRIAAATHPDRDDGGDPARFAAAAAAYATLRTSYGRGEARADLRAPAAHSRHTGTTLRLPPGVLRPLAVTLVAAVICTVAFLAAGWSPGSVGVLTGALTFVAVTCLRQARP